MKLPVSASACLLAASCSATPAAPENLIGVWECRNSEGTQLQSEFAADGSVNTAVQFKAAGIRIHGRFRGTWRMENGVLLREERMLPKKRADAPKPPHNYEPVKTQHRVHFEGADKMVLSGETEWVCVRVKAEEEGEAQ